MLKSDCGLQWDGEGTGGGWSSAFFCMMWWLSRLYLESLYFVFVFRLEFIYS